MLKKILYLTASFFSLVTSVASVFCLYDAIDRYNHGELWYSTVNNKLHTTYINEPNYCKLDIIISSYIALFSLIVCIFFFIKASPFITAFYKKTRAKHKNKKMQRLLKRQIKIENLINSMKE